MFCIKCKQWQYQTVLEWQIDSSVKTGVSAEIIPPTLQLLQNIPREQQTLVITIPSIWFKYRASAENVSKAAQMSQSSLDVPVHQSAPSMHHEYIAVICVLSSSEISTDNESALAGSKVEPLTIRNYNNVQNSCNYA